MPHRDLAKRKAYMKQYAATHPKTCSQEQEKRWTHAATCRKYGITPEIFDAVFLAQGSRCGCCGDREPGGKGSWHIDHDHVTNQFRGILCYYCNLGLGQFKDSGERLQKAIAYLAKFQPEKR